MVLIIKWNQFGMVFNEIHNILQLFGLQKQFVLLYLILKIEKIIIIIIIIMFAMLRIKNYIKNSESNCQYIVLCIGYFLHT